MNHAPATITPDHVAPAAVRTFTEAQIASVDLDAVRRKLLANERAIAAVCHERTDVLRGLLVAILTGEHALMLGPPGTAKSYVARTFAAQFECTYGEHMLTRQTVESDLLHYFDVPAYMAGVKTYRYSGMLTEAEIAFVDEAFKGPETVLNACLAWINERKVAGGYRSPLVSMIAASNECADGATLEAFDDRILVRYWVDRIQDRNARLALLDDADPNTGAANAQIETVTYLELVAAQRAARAIPVDLEAKAGALTIQDTLCAAGVYVSDRRIKAAGRLLRACAWLDGCSVVEVDHLDFFRNVLWKKPDERASVDAAIGTVGRGLAGEIRGKLDKILADYRQAKSRPDFPSHAWEVASRIQSGWSVVREEYKPRMTDRLRARLAPTMAEVQAAFDDCQAVGKAGGLKM